MTDRADDLKIGIRTAAITLGMFDVPAVMAFYAIALALLAWIGQQHQLGLFFFSGLGLALIVAAYHFFLIRHRDPSSCFRAFRHNTWFGGFIFAGIALDFWAKADISSAPLLLGQLL